MDTTNVTHPTRHTCQFEFEFPPEMPRRTNVCNLQVLFAFRTSALTFDDFNAFTCDIVLGHSDSDLSQQ